MTEIQLQRLFVALWPDSEVRSALVRVQSDLRLADWGRLTPAQNLHITMQFLGELQQSQAVEIASIIESIEFPVFSISIDQVSFWPHNYIVWAGPSDTDAKISELSIKIRKRLEKYAVDKRKFSPHITLARKVRRRIKSEITPIEWPVRQVHLVRSTLSSEGARYELLVHSKVSD